MLVEFACLRLFFGDVAVKLRVIDTRLVVAGGMYAHSLSHPTVKMIPRDMYPRRFVTRVTDCAICCMHVLAEGRER